MFDKLSTDFQKGKVKFLAKPSARKTELLSYDKEKNAYRIAIAAPPENNKANIELLNYIQKKTKKQIEFVSGLSSKTKILQLKK